jgi:CubicO group peptidase (beta-lactamase class C family)
LIDWALRYRIDRTRREVTTTVAGGFASRAVFRGESGCLLVHDPRDARQSAPTVKSAGANHAAPAPAVEPADREVRAALDLAFAEPDPAHPRWTKAVVVMHAGKLIAERYAEGYGPYTPIWGHSLTKCVTSALIGILVQQGELRVDERVPLAAWRAPDNPHHGITVEQLLRMTSGLPFDETNNPLNPATRMWFLERDMAGFAARFPLEHPPGSTWGYSNLGYLILSRLVRDAAGGGALDAERFAHRELFEPLGMHTVTFDADATRTLVGASHMYASARDWARFGQLYLDDGVVDGRRILPPGWAAYSASQTLKTGYGAGFWTNRLNEGSVPFWDTAWGMPELPRDMFFGRGYLGQFLVIVPDEQLVVARFGLSHSGGTGIGKVVARIIAALHARPPKAQAKINSDPPKSTSPMTSAITQ